MHDDFLDHLFDNFFDRFNFRLLLWRLFNQLIVFIAMDLGSIDSDLFKCSIEVAVCSLGWRGQISLQKSWFLSNLFFNLCFELLLCFIVNFYVYRVFFLRILRVAKCVSEFTSWFTGNFLTCCGAIIGMLETWLSDLSALHNRMVFNGLFMSVSEWLHVKLLVCCIARDPCQSFFLIKSGRFGAGIDRRVSVLRPHKFVLGTLALLLRHLVALLPTVWDAVFFSQLKGRLAVQVCRSL